MNFLDLFSDKAALYASARPRYPDELFRFIAAQAPRTQSVWDCGTGNGQAAVSLASHFDSVCASDPSSEQIAHAIRCTGVEYSVQPAERTIYPPGHFDAVCVAQALHWFDLPAFFREVLRVTKPQGIFATWGYDWFKVSAAFDAAFKELVLAVIAADWAPQNKILWNGYRDVAMPFAPLPVPSFQIRESWNLAQLLAYVHSWSATRRCMERQGTAFFAKAASDLERHWGDAGSRKDIVMPLHLRMGRVEENIA